MAKVKARDIVEGWPRGRSTSTLSLPERWMLDWPMNREEGCHELIREIEYHESQQRMVNEYFEAWRKPKANIKHPFRPI